MKREFLKSLNLDDSTIDQIMNENGKDINTARASKDAEIESLKLERDNNLKALNDLTGKYNAQVEATKDYAELKEFKAGTLAKQEASRKEDWLKAQGCKRPELLVGQIDFSKATYDEGKKEYTGLEEQIKNLKGNYTELFEAGGTQNPNPQPRGTFQPNGGKDAYLKNNPEMAPYYIEGKKSI